MIHLIHLKGYKQLWPYINRFNTIINLRPNENYDWISNAIDEFVSPVLNDSTNFIIERAK